jgi:hypothetical protein
MNNSFDKEIDCSVKSIDDNIHKMFDNFNAESKIIIDGYGGDLENVFCIGELCILKFKLIRQHNVL